MTNTPSSAEERRLCAEERKKVKAKEKEQKLVERNCDQEAQREKKMMRTTMRTGNAQARINARKTLSRMKKLS